MTGCVVPHGPDQPCSSALLFSSSISCLTPPATCYPGDTHRRHTPSRTHQRGRPTARPACAGPSPLMKPPGMRREDEQGWRWTAARSDTRGPGAAGRAARAGVCTCVIRRNNESRVQSVVGAAGSRGRAGAKTLERQLYRRSHSPGGCPTLPI